MLLSKTLIMFPVSTFALQFKCILSANIDKSINLKIKEMNEQKTEQVYFKQPKSRSDSTENKLDKKMIKPISNVPYYRGSLNESNERTNNKNEH